MRVSINAWAMEVAQVTAKRSTCCRRSVGCVVLNNRGHLVATGFNGVASGLPHCNEISHWEPVPGAVGEMEQPVRPNACAGSTALSGTNLDACDAIHAEQNALLQCRDVWDIESIYATTAPCVTCTKLLMNTSCKNIFFLEDYPHSAKSQDLWSRAGRNWIRLSKPL